MVCSSLLIEREAGYILRNSKRWQLFKLYQTKTAWRTRKCTGWQSICLSSQFKQKTFNVCGIKCTTHTTHLQTTHHALHSVLRTLFILARTTQANHVICTRLHAVRTWCILACVKCIMSSSAIMQANHAVFTTKHMLSTYHAWQCVQCMQNKHNAHQCD